jgi:hypothetical protein
MIRDANPRIDDSEKDSIGGSANRRYEVYMDFRLFPFNVNFNAFPTRLNKSCRNRISSPIKIAWDVIVDMATDF